MTDQITISIPLRIQVLKIFQAKGALDANDIKKLTGFSQAPVYAVMKDLRENGCLGFRKDTRPLVMFIKQKGLDLIECEENKRLSLDPDFIAKRESAFNGFLYPEVRCE